MNTETSNNPDEGPRVDRVRVKWITDEHPDLSYIGMYSNTPGEGCIDRQERGDMRQGQYRYFNASLDDPEYLEENYQRAERYNMGDWQMLGCVVEAIVSRPIGGGSRRLQEFTSSGLWGIESDSDKEYMAEVEGNEMADLSEHLRAFGLDYSVEQLRDKIKK